MAKIYNKKRLIDSLAMPEHPRTMHVFVVGLCRTGTTSIRDALGEFGYKVHGMREVNFDNHGKYWREAIRLKFYPEDPASVGMKPYGPLEFRKLFADYNGITDLPGVLFIEEIREAFPEAKIVVSNRNVESWKRSMDATILKIMRWRSMTVLAHIYGGDMRDNLFTGTDSVSQVVGDRGPNLDDQRTIDGFVRHYEELRKIIPAEQRLEYSVSEGWEPLCKFLELDVPNQPFPHVNDSKEFISLFTSLWWFLLGTSVLKTVALGGVLTYGGVVASRYLQKA